jgi:hypothetical protein
MIGLFCGELCCRTMRSPNIRRYIQIRLTYIGEGLMADIVQVDAIMRLQALGYGKATLVRKQVIAWLMNRRKKTNGCSPLRVIR